MSTISSKRKNFAVLSLPHRRIAAIQRALLFWYKEKGRDLPWRHTRPVRGLARACAPKGPLGRATSNGARDPYKVLVSEIMLQQTQVGRVIPKYNEFLRAFPTVRHLARAPLSGVIQLWAGLGYNRRAVYLHEAAKVVVEKFGGRVPTTIAELETLPGVGVYTAGAVAAFAGGSRKAFLDTNIKRIFGRLFFNTTKRRLPNEKDLIALAQRLIPQTADNAYAWHHALMDLGALVCAAGKPKCETCPLERVCPFPPFRDAVTKSHYAKRQSAFKDSDRFWRGRILDAVRRKKRDAPFAIPAARIEKIIQGLIRDGLVVRASGILSLPK